MLGLFFGALVNHWIFSFGGVVLVIFAVVEKIRQKNTEAWAFWGGAILCLFIACYGAWVDEHQNTQTVIAEKARAVGDVGECRGDSKSTSAQNVLLQSQVNSQQSTLTKMQQGVNSQQGTFNLCVTTLTKANAPVPMSTTLLKIGDDTPNPATKHTMKMVILTNKEVTPVKILLWCDGTIKAANVRPLGGVSYSAGITPLSSGSLFVAPKFWQINMSFPAWSPEQPLLIQLDYDVDDLGSCVTRS
jgi:hypothetical protein